MGYRFDRSKLIKVEWGAAYYGQVMSLLRYVEKHGGDVFGISPERAGHIADILFKYARLSEDDSRAPFAEMTIRVSLFYNELSDVDSLVGYAMGGGVTGWDLLEPDSDEVVGYFNTVAAQSRAYFAERDRKVAEAAHVAEKKRQAWEQEMVRKAEREAVLLQRIRSYVAECRAKGERPVKRHMVDEEFTQSIVLKVWKRFEAEQDGAVAV